MIRIIILCLFLMVPSVSAGFEAMEYLYSSGAIHAHSSHQWETGDDLQVWPYAGTVYHGGAAGQGVTTSPAGTAEYDSKAVMTAGYTSETALRYQGGGTYYDTLYTRDLQPNESELACSAGDLSALDGGSTGATPDESYIDAQVGGMGDSARYESDKLVDAGTYGISAKYEGTGLFAGRIDGSTKAGADKNSTELNYAAELHRDVFTSSNLTGQSVASIDWTFTGPSDIFNETNESAS